MVNPLVACTGKYPGVVFKPFESEILFEGYVVYPRVHDHNPMVKDFIAMTKEQIGKLVSG